VIQKHAYIVTVSSTSVNKMLAGCSVDCGMSYSGARAYASLLRAASTGAESMTMYS
jgi:hypothetical protein